MGADSTIVNAAFKESLSRQAIGVPDMSKAIEGNVKISNTYLKGFRDIFANLKVKKDLLEAAQNEQLERFKETSRRARAHILEKESSQPMKVHNAIYDKFKALENEFLKYNTTGDDDTAENEKMRADLYAQLQIITNQAVTSRGNIATASTMEKDAMVKHLENPNDIAVATAIMDVTGNYEHVELSFDKNNELVYHVQLPGMDEAVSWTWKEFNEKIIFHNKQFDVYIAERRNAIYNQGLTTNKAFDIDQANSEKASFLETVIAGDKKNFTNYAWKGADGQKPWVESLYDGENYDIAIEGVKHLFEAGLQDKISLVDVDGDGIITIADVDSPRDKGKSADQKITEADLTGLDEDQKAAWEINVKNIMDALTRTDHKAFNLELSSNLLANYVVSDLSGYVTKGVDDRVQPKGTELTIPQQAQAARAKRIDTIVAQEDPSLLEMNSIIGGSDNRYKIEKEGNEYVIYDRSSKQDNVPMERFNVKDRQALQIYLYNYSGTKRFYGTGVNAPGYDYQPGDTIDNPIIMDVDGDVPVGIKSEEGIYYKNYNSGKIYIGKDGKYDIIYDPKDEQEVKEDEI